MWAVLFGSLAVLVVAALLFMPVRLVFRWSGGLVQLRLRFIGVEYTIWERDLFSDTTRHKTGHEWDTAKVMENRLLLLARCTLGLIDHRDTLIQTARALLKLAGRSCKSWRFERGRVELAIGVGNPASTGMIHAALAALSGIVTARWPLLTVSSNPDFQGCRFASSGELIFRARAGDTLWDVIRLTATIPWRSLRKMKRDLAYP